MLNSDMLYYPQDVRRIRAVILEKCGVKVSQKFVYKMWQRYSDDYCASWLILPDEDDAIVGIYERYSNPHFQRTLSV